MRKFEFGKAYEEIEINGKPYQIDFSDDKLKQYQDMFYKFYQEAQEIEQADIEKMTPEEQTALLDKQRQNMKTVTETMLGEGTFDELFELAGRSTWNYMKLIEFLAETIEQRFNEIKEERRKKYVKKGK
jgi:phosphomevalonate kinase